MQPLAGHISVVQQCNLEERLNNENDTDYLNSIPSMAEMIIKEAERPLSEYSDTLDW